MGSIRARMDNGLLFFDFRFQGQRCREQTLLENTPGGVAVKHGILGT